jgi:excisionase family DNA binding protein
VQDNEAIEATTTLASNGPAQAMVAVQPSIVERVYRQLFDRESLAEYLRLSTDTVDRLVKAGKLPCVRIGHQVRFTFEDVDGFIERHRRVEGAAR